MVKEGNFTPAIILVAPQMGENIGASARAMKNFGLSDLRIVNPRDSWPNKAAESMSVGAIEIINSAKIYDDLEDAIKDLEYLYAATAARRDMHKENILSCDLPKDAADFSKIGIMFGRESSGLTNEEISYANKIVTIDTDPSFSSLNIAHAVAVVSYELYKNHAPKREFEMIDELVDLEQKNHFNNQLIKKLEDTGFFRVPEKKEQMQIKIRNLFGRIDKLSKTELKILYGVFNLM
jgi:tRNA/rRNA methyltransferase